MEPITSIEHTNTLQSDILPELPLRVSTIPDYKEYERFVRNIVSQVRRTYEYQMWVKYVKDTLGHNICALSGEVSKDVTIEIHHHPLTLFDICESVVNTHTIRGEQYCSADITVEVLECHYKNIIGYIPLCTTLHEKYHNNALNISINLVHGNWKAFLATYDIPTHIMTKVNKLENIKVTTNFSNWNETQIQ